MSAHPGGASGRKNHRDIDMPLDGSISNSKRKNKDGDQGYDSEGMLINKREGNDLCNTLFYKCKYRIRR